MSKTYEGICPRCKEWTEVSVEDNGCCDMGVYIDGTDSRICADEIEDEEALAAADLKADEIRIEKYFGGN